MSNTVGVDAAPPPYSGYNTSADMKRVLERLAALESTTTALQQENKQLHLRIQQFEQKQNPSNLNKNDEKKVQEQQQQAPVPVGPQIQDTSVRVLELALPVNKPPGFSLSQPGYSKDPLHLMTNIKLKEATSYVMYHLRFHGHHFRACCPFDIVAVGYQYGANGHSYDGIRYSFDGNVKLETYESKSGYLTFKISSPIVWHASTLLVDFLGAPLCYHQRGRTNLLTNGFQLVCHSCVDL